MLQRNLLYTGVTRGKRLVVLVGQKKKAVAIAVRSVSGGAVGRSLASGYARLLPRSGRTRCEDYGDAAVDVGLPPTNSFTHLQCRVWVGISGKSITGFRAEPGTPSIQPST
jgi:hypothetical protein